MSEIGNVSQLSLEPTIFSRNERMPALDIIRGFAVFGILLVNITVFRPHPEVLRGTQWSTPPEQLTEQFILFFAQGKFITLFSVLFGLGFAIQLERMQAHGKRSLPFYLRRLGILLLIGLIHYVFIWRGDILTTYALIGLLLIPFSRCRPRTLLLWVGGLLSLLLVVGVVASLSSLGRDSTPSVVPTNPDLDELLFRNGFYPDLVMRRLNTLPNFLAENIAGLLLTLPNFLLGLYLGKRETLRYPAAQISFLRHIFWIGLVVGIIGNLLFIAVYNPPDWLGAAGLTFIKVVSLFGILGLSSTYLAGIILLVQKPGWQKWLMPLGTIGRMALTNYLLQSLIMTTLFYRYGLNWWGKVGPLQGILLALLIYVLQFVFSVWWMKHFYFGPVEWLWRSLTYGHLQPFRLKFVKV